MNSDKSVLQRAFNTQFMDLIDDIVRVFPENLDMLTARESFEQIKKLNPSAIIKAWHIYVYTPYAEIIQSGDLDFFFDKDYTNDLTGNTSSSEILRIIEKIRMPLRNMGDVNKEHTKGYLRNLNKLSFAYSQI